MEAVSSGDRSVSIHQCLRKPQKDGYCKQHHPDTKKAKKEAWAAEWERKKQADEAVKEEAQRLADALGLGSRAYVVWQGKYLRRLSISFEDAETLIGRLR